MQDLKKENERMQFCAWNSFEIGLFRLRGGGRGGLLYKTPLGQNF